MTKVVDYHHIKTKKHPGVTVIAITATQMMDRQTVEEVFGEITREIDRREESAHAMHRNPRPVVLDLESVEHMGTSVFGEIISLQNKVKAQSGGGKLVIANANPGIRSALANARLDQILTIADSLDQAFSKATEGRGAA